MLCVLVYLVFAICIIRCAPHEHFERWKLYENHTHAHTHTQPNKHCAVKAMATTTANVAYSFKCCQQSLPGVRRRLQNASTHFHGKAEPSEMIITIITQKTRKRKREREKNERENERV